jgi:hypothetical protein
MEIIMYLKYAQLVLFTSKLGQILLSIIWDTSIVLKFIALYKLDLLEHTHTHPQTQRKEEISFYC